MIPAILSELAANDIPVETVDTSIPLANTNDAVITPVEKKTFYNYFNDDVIKILTVLNSLYIFGCIMDWW